MFNPNLISRLPQPLSCRLLAPLLTRYVEAAASLTPSERKSVADHLHACSACAEETEAIQAMSGFLQERAPSMLPVPTPHPELWERIEARIIAEERPVKNVKPVRAALVFAPAFAALIVAAVVVPRLGHQGTPVADTAKETNAPAAVATTGDPVSAQKEPQLGRAAALPAPLAAPQKSFTFADAQEANTVPAELRSSAKPVVVAVNRPRQASATMSRSRSNFAKTKQQVAMGARLNLNKQRRDFVVISIVPPPPMREQAQLAGAGYAATATKGNMLSDSKPMATYAANDLSLDKTEGASARAFAMRNAHVLSVPAPHKVAPAAPTINPIADSVMISKTITVVDTKPGNGVPESSAYPTPVTETLIRSRQRRGLFGGYGAGVTAMLPAGSTPKTSESGVPW